MTHNLNFLVYQAFDLSKDSSEKSKSLPLINEDIYSMQNPNFLKDGIDTEENETGNKQSSQENSKSQDSVPEAKTNYGKMLLNRALLLLILFALFIVLASLRSIKVFNNRPTSNSTTTSKPVF